MYRPFRNLEIALLSGWVGGVVIFFILLGKIDVYFLLYLSRTKFFIKIIIVFNILCQVRGGVMNFEFYQGC